MQLTPFNYKLEFNLAKNIKNKDPEIVVKNNDGTELINTLSTGERNNLALIYFISQAQEKIENKEINQIIIDDPVDGGDFYSYFLMRNFIKSYFSKEEKIKVVILTHNFDYLLIQLAGTDLIYSKCGKKLIDNIDIMKITKNGGIIKISKEEINSDNKTIYFKLTEYLSKKTTSEPLLVTTWIIWTRKIIEELGVNNEKLNNGAYISDVEPFAALLFGASDEYKKI